jgi:hypothetical protein
MMAVAHNQMLHQMPQGALRTKLFVTTIQYEALRFPIILDSNDPQYNIGICIIRKEFQ